MLSFVLALMGFAITASSLSARSVGSVQPDIVTTTRFVFTCPCESTSSVSFGTSYPTSPAKVTSNGQNGSPVTSNISPTGTFGTQSYASVSTTSSAGNSAPTAGQPFGIQVSTSGTRHKRTLSSIGAVDGELVLVESELEALAFMLSEEGALLIYETELAIGYSGSVGASPLVVYPSVVALPPLMAFSVADGALAVPAATFCTTSSNVLSVNNANSTDPSCAAVTATANTAPEAYNTAVANNVTASPLVSSNATTTATTSTSATSISTTVQSTPTALAQCDPNTNDGCSSGCEYCVVPTAYTGSFHTCNSLMYCHGCSYNSDCAQYGEGFTCGTYSSCSYNNEWLGTACAKAEPAVCGNNATLSSVISSSSSTVIAIPTATGPVTNGTTNNATSIVTAIQTAIGAPQNGTTADITTAPTSTATSNATTSAVCNITSLPDVTRQNSDTIATYTNFIEVCGKGLVEHSWVYTFESPNYNGFNFTGAVGECIQHAIDQLAVMVSFQQASNDWWYCVGAPSGANASSFVPFSGMQYAWGYEVVQTQAVLPTYQSTSSTPTSLPSSIPVPHPNSTTTSHPTSTFTSRPSSIPASNPSTARTSQPSSTPTFQPTFTSSTPPAATTGCTSNIMGDISLSSGATFHNFYAGCQSSIKGNAVQGQEATNYQTVMEFDAGADGNHGDWTIPAALSKCAVNTVTNNATVFEFYVNANNNNWYCVAFSNQPSSPDIFFHDSNVQDVWGFGMVNPSTTATYSAN